MKTKIIAGLVVFTLAACAVVFAEEKDLPFQSKVSYDIYLQDYADDLDVIADVEILRVQEIQKHVFLVIRPAEFTLETKEGFVLFDSVRAILPSARMKIQRTNRINVKY